MKDVHQCAFRWNALQLQGSRRRQEDDYIVRRLGGGNWVLAIADGLGGHQHGDRASDVAVDRIADQVEFHCQKHFDVWLMTRLAWARSFLACDEYVRQIPSEASHYLPATTLIAAHLNGFGSLSIAAIGDSMAWHLSATGLRLLLERQGSGSEVDNAIGLGAHNVSCLKTTTVALAPGERLIFATDGIDSVPTDDLAVIFGLPLDQVVESLIAAIRAVNDPDQDNVTVVILEVIEAGAP